MLIKRPADIRSSEITDQKLYVNRRQFIQAAGAIAGAVTGVGVLTKGAAVLHAVQPAAHGRKLANVKKGSPFSNTNGEVTNTWEQITTYNNFYEFGTDKDQPAELSRNFKTDAVDGLGRRRVRQAGQVLTRRHPQGRDARRAHLPDALRRSLVDGDPVGRHPARRS